MVTGGQPVFALKFQPETDRPASRHRRLDFLPIPKYDLTLGIGNVLSAHLAPKGAEVAYIGGTGDSGALFPTAW